jgi:hypothetical protein
MMTDNLKHAIKDRTSAQPVPINRHRAARVRDKVGDLLDVPVDKHLERIGMIMDRAIRIPGTQIRIGLDPIIGFLFPVLGDWIGGGVGAYIILASMRHGLPKRTIARMVFNLGVDFALGSIPLIGDAFDFAWKSNDMNLRLLNKYASGHRGSLWSDWALVFGLLGLLLLLMLGALWLVVIAIRSLGIHLI